MVGLWSWSPKNSTDSSRAGGNDSTGIIAGSAVGGAVLLTLVGLGIWYLRKRRQVDTLQPWETPKGFFGSMFRRNKAIEKEIEPAELSYDSYAKFELDTQGQRHELPARSSLPYNHNSPHELEA
jgi:hypothetical protein